MAISANRLELLQIADAVAREKSIDRRIVIGAMEDAIAKAARSRYGIETDVHAEIDPKSGELKLLRHMLVVESVENPSNQISQDEARRHHPAPPCVGVDLFEVGQSGHGVVTIRRCVQEHDLAGLVVELPPAQ